MMMTMSIIRRRKPLSYFLGWLTRKDSYFEIAVVTCWSGKCQGDEESKAFLLPLLENSVISVPKGHKKAMQYLLPLDIQ